MEVSAHAETRELVHGSFAVVRRKPRMEKNCRETVLRLCGEMSISAVFEAVSGSMKCGYSKFHRCLEMLDTMRLVDVTHVRGKGGKKMVTLRYEPERVKEVCE